LIHGALQKTLPERKVPDHSRWCVRSDHDVANYALPAVRGLAVKSKVCKALDKTKHENLVLQNELDNVVSRIEKMKR